MLRFCDTINFRGILGREQDMDGGAASEFALCFDPTAVQLGDVFDDGKPETSAAQLATARLIDAIKSLEDARQVLFPDADAGVAHSQRQPAVKSPRAKPNLRALTRIFHRIIEKVVENLLQTHFIRADNRDIRCKVDNYAQILVPEFLLPIADHAANEIVYVYIRQLQIGRA